MQNPLIIVAGLVALIGLVLMVFLSPFGSGTSSDSTSPVSDVAIQDAPIIVNGEAIPDIDIQFATNAALQVYRQLYSQLNIDFEEQLVGTAGEYQILQHRGDAAIALIHKELLFQEAARTGLSISEADIEARFNQNLDNLINIVFQTTKQDLVILLDDQLSRQQFQQVLFDFGVLQVETGTYAEFERQVRAQAEEELVEEKFRDQLATELQPTDSELLDFLEANRGRYALLFISPVVPSEPDLVEFFEANRDLYPEATLMDDVRDQVTSDFRLEAEGRAFDEWLKRARSSGGFPDDEEVNARHILIAISPNATQDEIDQAIAKIALIQSELRSGKEFGELAQTFSDDRSNSSIGGDLGWFGHGRMVPEFDQAAFALEIGEVSDVVRTQFGFHLIELQDRRFTTTTKDRLAAEFEREQSAAKFEEWVSNQLERSEVIYNDPALYAYSIEQRANQAADTSDKLAVLDEAIAAYETAKSVSVLAPTIGYIQSQLVIRKIEALTGQIGSANADEGASLQIRIAELKRVAVRRFLQSTYTAFDIEPFQLMLELDASNPELIFAYAEFLLDERYDLIGALEQLTRLQQDFPNYNAGEVAGLLGRIEQDEGLGPDGLPGRPIEIESADHLEAGAAYNDYNSVPPTSGPHYANIAPYGIHENPIPNELQVHNLEHGAVIIQYAPSASTELISDLLEFVEDQRTDQKYCRLMLAPYPGLDQQVALTAWGRLLKLDDFDLGLIVGFVETFLDQAPESVDDCSIN